jgi:hypothetical protein
MWYIVIMIASALILVNAVKTKTKTEVWYTNPLCLAALGVALIPVLNVIAVILVIVLYVTGIL